MSESIDTYYNTIETASTIEDNLPLRPPRPCANPGCPALVRKERYCKKHAHLAKRSRTPLSQATKREQWKKYDKTRPNPHRRGYTDRWRRASRAHLAEHPLCVKCGRAAEETDHIIPHKGDMELFWDRSNWQSLCKPCHSLKSHREIVAAKRQQRQRR